ncbi:hypothetical protein N7471_009702 [Penicillium samsonianum]|uniref:uncharacterized protein n=1 Tax=Penicillium samsonianum TaxID=1882272 RepID=UPI0025488EE2|nr:uncharacterized protein N7471_009702 [Penicillium samsonianum]KAJ6128485.1 hypothetical protein N7471_009702 [Penicillium samsonianum]
MRVGRVICSEPRAPTKLAVARRRAPSPLTIYIMSMYPRTPIKRFEISPPVAAAASIGVYDWLL